MNKTYVELLDSRTLAVGGLDLLDLDDLDAIGLGAMASTHVSVALGDGPSDRVVAVLTVHVVVARARIVTQPHTEVLHHTGPRLEHLQGNRVTIKILSFRPGVVY